MPATPDQPAVTFTPVHRLAALAEHTGDLDKAEVLQKAIPQWLAAADLKVVQSLNAALSRSHLTHARASQVLARLKPLDVFCKQELTALLKGKWKLNVDVERDTLDEVTKILSGTGLFPLGYDNKITTTSRSLLHAAMMNFTDKRAGPGGFLEESSIKINTKTQSSPDITPAKFAALCRELDLGARYQRHINEVLAVPVEPIVNAPAGASASTLDIRQLKLLDMRVATHMAYLKKDIGSAAYRMLLNVIEQDVTPANIKNTLFEGASVIWQGLAIDDICLHGVLVFSKVSIDTDPKAQCVVYMPDEPRRPLFEYASLDELKTYLTLHLQSVSYRKRFAERFFAGHDKFDFSSRFDQDKVLGTLSALPADTCPGDFFFSAFVTKAQEDARILAVPTADVDEQQRQKLLQALLDAGVLLLNAASFFVPVLGQLMLTAAVVEMVSEVYEGIEDWSHGERTQALSHLLNVVEGVAQMAAFAAGGKVVGNLVGTGLKEQAAFFDGFEAVTRADGKARLWKPDLRAYRQTSPLAPGLKPDAQGVYTSGESQAIVMDGATYKVARNTPGQDWRIAHPTRSQAFGPGVERTLEGGWRHVLEHAHEWPEGGYALERTDPRLGEMEGDLTAIADITGMTPDRLLTLHERRLKVPQRVYDCAERCKLDRTITGLITAMERGETDNTAYVQEQLQVLTTLPGWPAQRFIEVLDEDETIIARYPKTAPADDEVNCVYVSQAQLAAGQLLDTVLKGLYPKEVEAMIGPSKPESSAGLLANKIATHLKGNRQPLFERLYETYDGTASGEVALLRGLAPDLPTRIAEELLQGASGKDRAFLGDRRMLGSDLARQVHEARFILRQDRALTGLHLLSLANADTDRLMIGLMDRLQGWDDGFRLEVREGAQTGKLLDSVGDAQARSRGVIVKTLRSYQVTQGNGNLSSTLTSDRLPQAILDALPANQRTRMGFTGNDAQDTTTLQFRLSKAGAGDPARTARLLRGEPADAPKHLSACVQADPPEVKAHARSLIRKVRKLYPSFTEVQASEFLDGAGSTALQRANRIRELERQLESFRKVLHAWRDDEAQMARLPGKLNDVRVSRRQVANAIEDCWQRVSPPRGPINQPYTTLTLERNPVGQLPTLSEQDVAHVRTLLIKDMQAGDELAYFLRPFKGLTRLELDHNRLTRLPEALSHMPDLQYLSLNDNQLVLTEHTLRKLADMRGLRTLSLSGNRLGATLDVSNMFDLHALFLAQTHATELPVGLNRLPYLDIVDLRGNEIRKLPDWLLDAPQRLAETINLRHNPLSSESLANLKIYRDRTGHGMGFLENDAGVINEQMARDLWMPRSVDSTFVRRNHTWQALKNQPASDGFFRLLAEVGSTADSRYVREDMTRRVWEVIEATERGAELRDQLLSTAVKSNCTDSAATIFSHLEVAVEIDKVVRLSANAHDRADRLLKLGRSLFNLDYLTKVAAEKAKADPALDPVEVQLAYRTGLAEKLELIGQPRHMRYASLSGVTPADLDTAYNRVVTAQLSPELLKYLSGRRFWIDFLREHHGQQFSDLAEPFHTRMQTAFDTQASLGPSYRSQVDGIMEEMQQAESALLERLTQAALTAAESTACFALD